MAQVGPTSISAIDNTAAIGIGNENLVAFEVNTVTDFSGLEGVFEATNDPLGTSAPDTNWDLIQAVRQTDGVYLSSTTPIVFEDDTAVSFNVNVALRRAVRFRCTDISSGSAGILMTSGFFPTSPPSTAVQGLGTTGEDVLGGPVLIGGEDSEGLLQSSSMADADELTSNTVMLMAQAFIGFLSGKAVRTKGSSATGAAYVTFPDESLAPKLVEGQGYAGGTSNWAGAVGGVGQNTANNNAITEQKLLQAQLSNLQSPVSAAVLLYADRGQIPNKGAFSPTDNFSNNSFWDSVCHPSLWG